ncbi:hypothetical protein SAY87_021404 [Trapa incisa]|uniref:Uncharacterized protein n=1 Tax=Trapa incisa TaxID=236973 RepID=A0AAN7JS14_9MYRT|nr:hypothetical protein SAY87_021404 [Trapa incisa]
MLTKVKLQCPSLSKTVTFEAGEEQSLDLGSIARAFELEPWSVRLNGQFISRGIDMISSVTWRSLLRFFTSKGLSTGKDDSEPLIVEGKLLTVGNKRTPDPEGSSVNCNVGAGHEEKAISFPHPKKFKCSNFGKESSGRFSCGYMVLNKKRGREDDVIADAPFKRVR